MNMSNEHALTENEEKREFLWSYRDAKRAVNRLEEQLKELRSSKISPSCMIGDGMPHSALLSDLSTYAAKLDELEGDIITARYRRITEFMKVQKAIEKMENERERDVLTYRYICGMKWEDITDKMNYKWRQVHRIHSLALKNLKVA